MTSGASCVRAREKRASDRPVRAARTARPTRRKRFATGILATLLTVACAVVVLNVVTPAGASSPVSRSPREAEKAGTVRFTSTLEVSIRGLRLDRSVEEGALNFQTGDYESKLSLGTLGERIERRLVGRVLYLGQFEPARHPVSPVPWHGVRLLGGVSDNSPAPGSYTLIDPQVVLNVLGGAPSQPAIVGRESVGGVATVHYRLDTTLYTFLNAQRAPSAYIRSLNDSPGALNVWLDQAGRPRRVEAAFAFSGPRGTNTMRAITQFADYGGAVKVVPPAGA